MKIIIQTEIALQLQEYCKARHIDCEVRDDVRGKEIVLDNITAEDAYHLGTYSGMLMWTYKKSG